jgi:hypothetical protein
VELDSPFGAEEMCLAEIATPAPKNENLNRLSSFALIFSRTLCVLACDVRAMLEQLYTKIPIITGHESLIVNLHIIKSEETK